MTAGTHEAAAAPPAAAAVEDDEEWCAFEEFEGAAAASAEAGGGDEGGDAGGDDDDEDAERNPFAKFLRGGAEGAGGGDSAAAAAAAGGRKTAAADRAEASAPREEEDEAPPAEGQRDGSAAAARPTAPGAPPRGPPNESGTAFDREVGGGDADADAPPRTGAEEAAAAAGKAAEAESSGGRSRRAAAERAGVGEKTPPTREARDGSPERERAAGEGENADPELFPAERNRAVARLLSSPAFARLRARAGAEGGGPSSRASVVNAGIFRRRTMVVLALIVGFLAHVVLRRSAEYACASQPRGDVYMPPPRWYTMLGVLSGARNLVCGEAEDSGHAAVAVEVFDDGAPRVGTGRKKGSYGYAKGGRYHGERNDRDSFANSKEYDEGKGGFFGEFNVDAVLSSFARNADFSRYNDGGGSGNIGGTDWGSAEGGVAATARPSNEPSGKARKKGGVVGFFRNRFGGKSGQVAVEQQQQPQRPGVVIHQHIHHVVHHVVHEVKRG